MNGRLESENGLLEKLLSQSDLIKEKLFSFLDAKSLALLGSCSHKFRKLTNSNLTWHKLCLINNYAKYEYLLTKESHPSITVTKSAASPIYVEPNNVIPTRNQLCHWRCVFNRAKHLEKNWQHGIYFIAPILKGHKGCVSSFDSDGSICLSSSKDDKSIKVWNVNEMECVNTIKVKSDSINSIKLYNDSIIAVGDEGVIKIYDKFEGDLKYTMGTVNSSGSANHVLIVRDKLAVSYSDKSIRIWSLSDHSILHILRGHEDDIECLTASKSYENIILSGSWDNNIILWNIQTGAKLINLIGHSECINSIKMLDQRVVSASSDSKLIIWNLNLEKNSNKKMCVELKEFLILSGHTSDVYCLDVNEDYIASGGADSLVIVWSFQTGQLLFKLNGHLGIVRFVRLIDEKKLVSGGDSKKIIVWNYKQGKMFNMLFRNPTKLNYMYIDDTKIITASPEADSNITVICYW